MKLNKLNVSFDITNIWVREDYRKFIELLNQTDEINLFLISKDNTSAYIQSVGTYLDLDSSRIITCNFNTDISTELINNNIHIHLLGEYDLITYLEENNPDTQCIYINFDNEIWINQWNFWSKRIMNGEE